MAIKLSATVAGVPTVTTRLEAVAEHLGDIRELLERIGQRWVQVLAENVEAQGRPEKFEKLAPATINLRRLIRGASLAERPILKRTGQMVRSAKILEIGKSHVVVGSTNFIARLMHTGGKTSPKSRIPNAIVPARPWVLIPEPQVQETFGLVEQYILEGVRA